MRRGCVLTLFILSAIAFALSVVYYIFVWPSAKRSGTAGIAYVIEDALEQYKADEGNYPAETDNAAVVKALYGLNPRKKDYLVGMESIIRQGQFTDYWRNPLKIEFPPGDRARVTSAGPDGNFGTPDDVNSQDLRVKEERSAAPAPAQPKPDSNA
jgi:hypothetical protein